jgi:hypothetical protein
VEVLLNILGHHAAGIRASCGLEHFLEPVIMPALFESIRTARMRRVWRILSVLLRRSPRAAASRIARYYASRVSIRRGSP